MRERPLVLISNDDGYSAAGIRDLATCVSKWAEVIVVAPDSPRSGAGCSITCTIPVSLTPINTDAPYQVWACSGSPVDCVKLALENVVPRKPDLLLSGINHGDNASISLLYSGTMGAVFEGCMKGIPAIGVSQYLKRGQLYEDHAPTPQTLEALSQLCQRIAEEGLPQDICLDINFPLDSDFQGWRVCRQARGSWSAEWRENDNVDDDDNVDVNVREHTCSRPISPVRSFWLQGDFTNLEPECTDTDMHALSEGFCPIVPLKIDLTAHEFLSNLKIRIASPDNPNISGKSVHSNL